MRRGRARRADRVNIVACQAWILLVTTSLWTVALAYASRILGERFERVDDFAGPITWIVIGFAAVSYVIRVVRIRRTAG